MIVKNESKIITRLFDSLIGFIDCYCICDTGSTDNTKEIIGDYFKAKNIPGKIVEEPFINFAHNRNYALSNCIGMSDYVLLLDADMVLQIKPGFNKSYLTGDSYHILQGNEDFYYNNVRIIKNDGLSLYYGVTHEYMCVPNNTHTEDLTKNQLFISDIGDGGSKTTKFERDIMLLTKGIEDEPDNKRYYFYLANSYHDIGKYEEAINYYRKRIEIGGWQQEVWYSYYRIGFCYKYLGQIEKAIYEWLNAYNYFPKRLENIYELVYHYRVIGNCQLAYHFYKLAKELLVDVIEDKDSYLFLSNDIYTYKFDYEYSIIACYVGIKNVNAQLIKIFNNSNDSSIVSNTFSNMKYYKDTLSPIQKKDISSSINYFIENDNEYEFTSSFASLTNNTELQNGYIINIQLNNYDINDINNDNNKSTKYSINKYIELTKDLKIIDEKIIDVRIDENSINMNNNINGITNVKIFNKNKDTIFIGLERFDYINNIGLSFGKYESGEDYLISEEIMENSNFFLNENKYSLLNMNDTICLINNWYPLEIYNNVKCKDSNKFDFNKRENMPKIFKYVNGSTNSFNYKNENWFVVYLISKESKDYYYHMFVIFDENMNLLRYSAPFSFENEDNEICGGIVVNDKNVTVTYTTNFKDSKIAVYKKKYIDDKIIYNEK
jgi:tetratricopeptide (TPR) repeat protein